MFLPPSPPLIGIVGLGYVGLPLALAFGRRFETIGYDIHAARVAELSRGVDRHGETQADAFSAAVGFRATTDVEALKHCNTYIVTVPTPVDEANRPDFGPLLSACRLIGPLLSDGDTVIFESTVYPGTTEEVCVPALEAASGKVFGEHFHVGYSPERINPGDRQRGVADIVKVTSGSSPAVAGYVDGLYATIVAAGTHRAPSLRVAEAAKVIENVQRDVNIALVNELAMMFQSMGIDTQDVLAAAGTKWNFLPFRPGLVGGHCIGVDPYYLTHKATVLGYHPELILAARRINNRVALHVAHQLLRLLARKGINAVGARVLVLGLSFKEDCADLRNTKVVDIIRELREANLRVDVHDPVADVAAACAEHGIDLLQAPPVDAYDAVLLAVAHRQFVEAGERWVRGFGRADSVVYDIKGVLPRDAVDGRL